MAVQVTRLIEGAPHAALPVEQPTKYELIINLKTAQALGVTLSPTLLLWADEVIK
jgi:putative ABC transport system substrate-binding protein